MTQRVLTGITTTGTPHLGNYLGAIRPAILASQQPDTASFFFLADYHALIKCDDPARVAASRQQIAATWLAAGLDPEQVTFYRQSDLPEVVELSWALACVTNKGLMNRAHAYKASVDANTAANQEPDDGVTMGLFLYPVLMAADILIFNAHRVPVGRDQIQHIEMARDIGQRFNHLYGGGREIFTLPEALIDENVATLPGLDGRKMSKSYNNTIPLFEGGAAAMQAAVARIVTDSRGPGEPKDPDSASLLPLYAALSDATEAAAFRADLIAGLGWGDAKRRLAERIEAVVGPMRERYETLIARPDTLEDIMQAGGQKAREQAAPLMDAVRSAVGLRRFTSLQAPAAKPAKAGGGKGPRLVTFRDDSGFRFRLLSSAGETLLLSPAFAEPRAAGQAMQQLRTQGVSARLDATATPYALYDDALLLGAGEPGLDAAQNEARLQALQTALTTLAAEA